MQKIIRRIFFGLVLVSLLAPWMVNKDLLFPFITSKALFFRLMIELALPLYVYLILANPKLRPSLKNPLSLSLLAFVLINFVSAFTGVNVDRSLWGNFERMGGAFYLATLVLLYFYVLLLAQLGGKYVWWFLNAVAILAGLMVLDGMLVWPFGKLVSLTFSGSFPWLFDTITDPSFPRISATLGNPIFLGSFLILSMTLCAYFALRAESRGKKIFYWLLAGLQLFGVFISGTRGAIVGLAIGIFAAAVVYVLLNSRRKVKIYGGLTIGIFVLVVGALFLKHQDLPKGSMLSRVFNLQDSNSEARLIQWRIALKGYPDRPLLGTGPENYYLVGNQYYNPELYKYDPSWFDKPHNYPLEILVTTGALGFAAYAAAILLGFWICWQAYKRELLSLPEFCVLAAGLLVYQIQNLFVFDTIPASLMFYGFLGFLGMLWQESRLLEAKQKGTGKISAFISPAFLSVVLAVSYAVVVYLIYATVIMPYRIAKDVNYGFAYASVDPQKAATYFDTAKNLLFNFDAQETGTKYADFAAGLAASSAGQKDTSLAQAQLQAALDYETGAANKIQNDPITWQKLGTLYLYQAMVSHTDTMQQAIDAVVKSINLAPKRREARILLAQIYDSSGQKQQALDALQQVSGQDPSNLDVKFQIATVKMEMGQADEAIAEVKDLLAQGFSFSSAQQMNWLLNYYQGKKDYQALLSLYRQAIKLDPGNSDLYFNLAKVDALTGNKAEASSIAASLLNYYQTQNDQPHLLQVKDFLQSLK